MPPKIKIKRRRSQTVTEEEEKLLTLDEIKARELRYSNQLTELKKCLKFIDEAQLQVSTLNEQQILLDKWQQFLSCNPLPSPNVPPDIRLFHSKLKHIEKENLDQNINWLLSANERSILTQDIFRQDLTRRKLMTTVKANIGEEYNNYIKDALQILHRIENFFDNESEVAKYPLNVLDDIMSRKSAIQKEIKDLINRFTYRIISKETLEMKSIDEITAEYFFKANDFKIHIWCLKNVPLRITQLSEPRLLANFHSINLLLHIPANMVKENLVIRALHINFDHLSENGKSFKTIFSVLGENVNGAILDISKCMVNEWFMQMEIQARVHRDMTKQRLDYEEKMSAYEEQLEKKKGRSKADKTSNKTKKISKPTKEPVKLEKDMFPDTYEEFLQEEQEQYENFCKSVYDPGLLNLEHDEINLRKYFILGGIYQIYYVEKPMQTDFKNFNMIWHYNEAKLKIDKDMKISQQSRASKQSRRSTAKRMTIFEAENKYNDADVECPWFIVTIELPKYLCLWGEPIVCHFEETTKKVKKLPNGETEKTKNSIENSKMESTSPLNINLRLSHNSNENNTNNEITLQKKHASAGQQIFRDSFYRDSFASYLLHTKKSESLPIDSVNYARVEDFPLTEILKKPQIRHIERHIIPRIISSYKFPKEINLEELELLAKRPRKKGGRILRRRNEDFQTNLSSRQFTFTQLQNYPERMFAKFSKVELLRIVSQIEEINFNDPQIEPETFAQLLQVVSEIKQKYRQRQYKAMDLKPLEKEVITNNKRIRQMFRKKEHSTKKSERSSATPSTKLSSIQKSIRLSKEHENNKTEAENVSELKAKSATTDDHFSIQNVTFEPEEEYKTETYWHWTTKYILKSEFDKENCKLVFKTDRLGNVGLAFKRYEHYPFRYWSMEPNKNDPDNEVIFTLDTQYVRCVLYITGDGIRGHVTESTDAYVRQPKMHLVIEKPIKDFKELKQLFRRNYLNIFAEHDARYYVENGYFSEKHLSNELHTYNCMAVHCTQMLFNFSLWNRLAKRRDIVLQFKHFEDVTDGSADVRITPGEAFFVDIRELCSDDLDLINLDYSLTWRNIGSYSDLHHLIVSMYPTATDLRCKNSNLICFIKNLLSEIRPLSFS